MADEPLYCVICGAEDWGCEHGPHGEGPENYCEVSGLRVENCRCQYCVPNKEVTSPEHLRR